LIDGTTDLDQLPGRVIRMNEKAQHNGWALKEKTIILA